MAEALFGSATNPLFVMLNAGTAGVLNMIPGVRETFTGIYHRNYDMLVQMKAEPRILESVRNASIAYGWW